MFPLSFEEEGEKGGEVEKQKARNLFDMMLQYVTPNA